MSEVAKRSRGYLYAIRKDHHLNSIPQCLAAILAILAMVLSLFLFGLMVAVQPAVVAFSGSIAGHWDGHHYPQDAMQELAVKVLDYSTGGITQDEIYDLEAKLIAEYANGELFEPDTSITGDDVRRLVEEAKKAASERNANNPFVSDGSDASYIYTTREQRYLAQFTLDDNALAHLSDCIPLFIGCRNLFIISALISIVLLLIIRKWCSKEAVGGILSTASVMILLLFAFLAVWALLDFRNLFMIFHLFLFSQGNWIFDSSSLLIQLFPSEFWGACIAVWVISSVLLAIVLLLWGIKLHRGFLFKRSSVGGGSGDDRDDDCNDGCSSPKRDNPKEKTLAAEGTEPQKA